MEVNLSFNYKMEIPDCKFETISSVIVLFLTMILADLFEEYS